MKVRNVHRRLIAQAPANLAPLLSTLATLEDRLFPHEQWPAMRFKGGLRPGAHGGHGPIRYQVKKIIPQELIEFEFTQPQDFKGTHRFEVRPVDARHTELVHTIEMRVGLWGGLLWLFGIRALHDALIEDAFDKVENQFGKVKQFSKWSLWVKVLRRLLK